MQFYTYVGTLFSLYLVLPSLTSGDVKEKCDICTDVIEKFDKGLKDTAKANFGGGNTRWEEKSLGKWATSETRFLEILERLCNDAGSTKKESACHTMIEAHEESLESWWFEEFPSQLSTAGLHKLLCIGQVQVCCPKEKYGKSCEQCPGTVDAVCSTHGDCDGSGTRAGTGKCKCHDGYAGAICETCKDGFYEVDLSDPYPKCEGCHESCDSTCVEGGPKGCDECRDGWTQTDEDGCVDVDECETEEDPPCGDGEFCVNTPGSYNCPECDERCEKCVGPSSKDCIKCADGYSMADVGCIDIDECFTSESPCEGEHALCINTVGSHKCGCEEGYVKGESVEEGGPTPCVPKPQEHAEDDSDGQKSTGDSSEPNSTEKSTPEPSQSTSEEEEDDAEGKKKSDKTSAAPKKKATKDKAKAKPKRNSNAKASTDKKEADHKLLKRFRPIDTLTYIASILVFIVFALVLRDRPWSIALFIACFSVFLYGFFSQFK